MMQQMLSNSYLFGGNMPFVEEMYDKYLENPASVPENWRSYFDSLQDLPGAGNDVQHAQIIASFAERAKLPAAKRTQSAVADKRQLAVLQIINAYRFLGNRWAQLDPLKRHDRPQVEELEPSYYGFTEADFGQVFAAGSLNMGKSEATLREILEALRQTYCSSVGAEYMYMSDIQQKRWIQARLEPVRSAPQFTTEHRKRLLDRLTAAETLERYLHTKYVGQKRFSLEGGESAIVALDEMVNIGGTMGVQEIVIGMAHRGRLNVLVNTLGKSPKQLFSEFEGKAASDLSAGDVKYHMGFSSDVATPGGPMHLTLAFNPSHLEIINPVVEGSVYSRQRRRGDKTGATVLPLLIHGDAAVAGQGVNQEMLNFANTRGYGTGGTIHLIINNQIGFTTSDPRDLRSSLYCTDIFKMVEAPIFHVNGDDPEAVAFVTKLAMEFRQEFKRDVVIDLICYRKLGHNEQDEPMVTQPLMYKKVQAHPGTRKLYADRLVAQKVCDTDEPDQMIKDYRAAMDKGELVHYPVLSNYQRKFSTDWTPFLKKPYTDRADTKVPMPELKRLAKALGTLPENFTLHSRVQKIIEDRRSMADGKQALDWGMAENLAYATLLAEGYAVRISGEDCGLCGLVLLLPHGYEGQGPEHSSARLERFMQLCAENNIEVCVPSTPAQMYHMLRRQMVRKQRKPLIVMTPKSLLRHKDAINSLEDLAKGTFQTVIGEVDELDAKKVTRVVACSGKVYYELLAARRENKVGDVAIVRLEQLYPFPADAFSAELKKYPKLKEIVWTQEEPLNQGAWYASCHHLAQFVSDKVRLDVAARPAAASPAVGYYAKHNAQQKAVIDSALGIVSGK